MKCSQPTGCQTCQFGRPAAGAARPRRQLHAEPAPARGHSTEESPLNAERHIADTHDLIRVRGARENNLKAIDVTIPRRPLTVFTGVSGSGKSSLVFDTAVDAERAELRSRLAAADDAREQARDAAILAAELQGRLKALGEERDRLAADLAAAQQRIGRLEAENDRSTNAVGAGS